MIWVWSYLSGLIGVWIQAALKLGYRARSYSDYELDSEIRFNFYFGLFWPLAILFKIGMGLRKVSDWFRSRKGV